MKFVTHVGDRKHPLPGLLVASLIMYQLQRQLRTIAANT